MLDTQVMLHCSYMIAVRLYHDFKAIIQRDLGIIESGSATYKWAFLSIDLYAFLNEMK